MTLNRNKIMGHGYQVPWLIGKAVIKCVRMEFVVKKCVFIIFQMM